MVMAQEYNGLGLTVYRRVVCGLASHLQIPLVLQAHTTAAAVAPVSVSVAAALNIL
jgi:hypothetical protein